MVSGPGLEANWSLRSCWMLESHCISEKEIDPNTHIGANSLLHLDQKTDLKIHTHTYTYTRMHARTYTHICTHPKAHTYR